MKKYAKALAAVLALYPVGATACSPPAPIPLNALRQQAEIIGTAEGYFSPRQHGGLVRFTAVEKGAPRGRLKIVVQYFTPRLQGSGMECPAINLLKGFNRGVFYLGRWSDGHYRILRFDPR